MGDDERNDYLYKFVSKRRFTGTARQASRRAEHAAAERGRPVRRALHGRLARGRDHGHGSAADRRRIRRRRPVDPPHPERRERRAGMSTEEVLVYTRLAADKVGATKMDRPEDVEPSPAHGQGVRGAHQQQQPRRGERRRRGEPDHGQPLRPRGRAHRDRRRRRGTTSAGASCCFCGDPSTNAATYFAGFPKEPVSPISCPDNVAFDSEGTSGSRPTALPGTIGYNDGLFKVPLEGASAATCSSSSRCPREAETCGPVIHDREGLVFVAVQHPGENGSSRRSTRTSPTTSRRTARAPRRRRGPRSCRCTGRRRGRHDHGRVTDAAAASVTRRRASRQGDRLGRALARLDRPVQESEVLDARVLAREVHVALWHRAGAEQLGVLAGRWHVYAPFDHGFDHQKSR